MKIDNFTTARCIKCNWIKQFLPGKEYTASEFACNCIIEEPTQSKGKINGRRNSTTKAD